MTNNITVHSEPELSPLRGADVDPVTAWIEEIILEHTPSWALTLAWLMTIRGLGWMQALTSMIRRFTDIEVKTETNMKSGPGFRPGSTLQRQTVRIFKRGRMLAERTFEPRVVRNSPYSKLK